MGMFDFGNKKPNKDRLTEDAKGIKKEEELEYDINYSSAPKNNRERELQRRKEEKEKKENKGKVDEVLKEKKDKEKDEGYDDIPESDDSIMGDKVEKVLLESKLGPYIVKDDVTDISYNGWDVYVQDSTGLHKIENSGVNGKDIEHLGRHVANISNKTFNTSDPILDTAIGRYRLNFMHSSVSPFGATTAIRVSKPSLAIKDVSKLANGSVIQFLNLCMKVGENMIISGQTGSGKSLPNDSELPTPEGTKLMGGIKVGDYVYDRKGKPTKVLGVYPQGKLDVYEIELIDGRKVRSSVDHIWTVITDKGEFKNYTVGEMLEQGVRFDGRAGYRFRIPNIKPVEKSEKEFKVHPYVMGAFIGDGCLTSEVLAISSEDDWIPSKVAKHINAVGVVKHKRAYMYYFTLPDDYDYELNKVHRQAKYYQARSLFSDEERCYSYEKRIPEKYFEGSIEQRYELLQGLMDTDGTIGLYDNKRSRVSYKTISEGLAKDVQKLASSLGISASIYKMDRGDDKYPSFDVTFKMPNEDKINLYSLPRKVEIAEKVSKLKNKNGYDKISIKNIRKLGYEDEMTCILVDNEEHLFATESYVLVHNTEFVRHVSI